MLAPLVLGLSEQTEGESESPHLQWSVPGRLETCVYYPVFSPKQTRDGFERGLSPLVLPVPLHSLRGEHIFELVPGTLGSTELVRRV